MPSRREAVHDATPLSYYAAQMSGRAGTGRLPGEGYDRPNNTWSPNPTSWLGNPKPGVEQC